AEAPRRYLAAPVAVGTVDQVMLAGLQTKWAHFRAAAVSRALLVIDEVHASDTYMAAVLGRVIRHHADRGGHALLLPATLGAAARAAWLGGPRAPPQRDAPYPSLHWRSPAGTETGIGLAHDGRSKSVSIRAEPAIAEPDKVAQMALEAAGAGGRVLV